MNRTPEASARDAPPHGAALPDEVPQSLGDEAESMLEEARMVLPGIQALFGFQLIAVFSDRFAALDAGPRATHFAATLLVSLAIALVMTPAAYHRIAERGRVSKRFVDLGSTMISLAMLPLAVAISIEIAILCAIALGSTLLAAVIGAALLAVFLFAWVVVPLAARRKRRSGAR